ncbi:MAG TPA: transcriptional regulator [Acidobacteriaceae bacterium]|nr:transcriptional regulator [Acidobacteriaceae bacterium]
MKKKSSSSAAPFAYEGLDRVIHERARLSVLTSLMTHPEGLSFVELKQLCGLTDGNLARHLQVLEEEKMVRLTKEAGEPGEGRGQTTARVTASGRKRYLEYLTTLEQVVRDAAAAEVMEAEEPVARKLAPANA